MDQRLGVVGDVFRGVETSHASLTVCPALAIEDSTVCQDPVVELLQRSVLNRNTTLLLCLLLLFRGDVLGLSLSLDQVSLVAIALPRRLHHFYQFIIWPINVLGPTYLSRRELSQASPAADATSMETFH